MTFATCTSTALCLQPFISFLKQIIMMKIKNLKNLDHVNKALSNSGLHFTKDVNIYSLKCFREQN